MSPSLRSTVPVKPVSSRTSRTAVCSGTSPSSTHPFGNAHADSPPDRATQISATSYEDPAGLNTMPPEEMWCRLMDRAGSVLDQGLNLVSVQLIATLERQQLHEKRDADDLAAELTDEIDGGCSRAAGGQQIIHDEDALTGHDRVPVH